MNRYKLIFGDNLEQLDENVNYWINHEAEFRNDPYIKGVPFFDLREARWCQVLVQ